MSHKNTQLAKENSALKASLRNLREEEERVLKSCAKSEYFAHLAHREALVTIDESLARMEETLQACRRARDAIEKHYARLKGGWGGGILQESNREGSLAKTLLGDVLRMRGSGAENVPFDRVSLASGYTKGSAIKKNDNIISQADSNCGDATNTEGQEGHATSGDKETGTTGRERHRRPTKRNPKATKGDSKNQKKEDFGKQNRPNPHPARTERLRSLNTVLRKRKSY